MNIAKERESGFCHLRDLMGWGSALGGMTLTIHAKAPLADGSDIEVNAVITLNDAEVTEAFDALDLHC